MGSHNELDAAYNRIKDLTADLRLSRFERRHLDEALEDFYHAKVESLAPAIVCNSPSPDGMPCWKLRGHVGAHQAATGDPFLAAYQRDTDDSWAAAIGKNPALEPNPPRELSGVVSLDLSDVADATPTAPCPATSPGGRPCEFAAGHDGWHRTNGLRYPGEQGGEG